MDKELKGQKLMKKRKNKLLVGIYFTGYNDFPYLVSVDNGRTGVLMSTKQKAVDELKHTLKSQNTKKKGV